MNKKLSRRIAGVMFLFFLLFLAFALTHPESGFPWGNEVTYDIYLAYAAVMAVLFLAPFKNK